MPNAPQIYYVGRAVQPDRVFISVNGQTYTYFTSPFFIDKFLQVFQFSPGKALNYIKENSDHFEKNAMQKQATYYTTNSGNQIAQELLRNVPGEAFKSIDTLEEYVGNTPNVGGFLADAGFDWTNTTDMDSVYFLVALYEHGWDKINTEKDERRTIPLEQKLIELGFIKSDINTDTLEQSWKLTSEGQKVIKGSLKPSGFSNEEFSSFIKGEITQNPELLNKLIDYEFIESVKPVPLSNKLERHEPEVQPFYDRDEEPVREDPLHYWRLDYLNKENKADNTEPLEFDHHEAMKKKAALQFTEFGKKWLETIKQLIRADKYTNVMPSQKDIVEHLKSSNKVFKRVLGDLPIEAAIEMLHLEDLLTGKIPYEDWVETDLKVEKALIDRGFITSDRPIEESKKPELSNKQAGVEPALQRSTTNPGVEKIDQTDTDTAIESIDPENTKFLTNKPKLHRDQQESDSAQMGDQPFTPAESGLAYYPKVRV